MAAQLALLEQAQPEKSDLALRLSRAQGDNSGTKDRN
jgi:hypothetical protein